MTNDTKTTIFGIVSGICLALCSPQMIAIEPALVHTIAAWVGSVGLGLLGYHAAGYDVNKPS